MSQETRIKTHETGDERLQLLPFNSDLTAPLSCRFEFSLLRSMRMRMMRIIIITFSYYRTYRKGKIRMGDGERRPISNQFQVYICRLTFSALVLLVH